MVTRARQGRGLVSVSEVAKRFAVSNQQVLRAIRAEKLRARKIGWSWVIDEKDLPRLWADLQG